MFRGTRCACTLIALGTISLSGCGGGSGPGSQVPAEHGDHDQEHAHATEGPHGGSIIELGTEEFHAELVHDDEAGSVMIYFLDSTAKQVAPIDAGEVSINLRHDGNAEQFKLAASPTEGDPQGKSSRFVSAEKELAEDLDRSDARGQLVATISGKQYRGNIEHDHDHGEEHQH